MEKIKKLQLKLKSTLVQYKRVLILLKKPTLEEYKLITKVTAIGLFLVGLIGFAIGLIMRAIL